MLCDKISVKEKMAHEHVGDDENIWEYTGTHWEVLQSREGYEDLNAEEMAVGIQWSGPSYWQ